MGAPRRRIPVESGQAAVAAWLDGAAGRSTVATAVRFTLEELASRAPGNSVEVRIPPYGVAQCVAGPRHTRGTPPNVVECDGETWLELVTGTLEWTEAAGRAGFSASGSRADLSEYLPLQLNR